MTDERLDKLENVLAYTIENLSERARTAAEVEALAAVVQALTSLLSVRTSAQGDQPRS